MAQKEIGIKLKITSEGQEKVINNLNDLETELSTLQSKLKTLDFGSDAFKEASTNIQILRTKIDDIDKATEGLGAEKRFRAIGDAINILTGSFQVLSGAIGLVVSNEQTLEEVQRAEKAALDVLNVALGINAINTALVESATLRKAAAEKLATLATRAATIAQAAWNAVLLANPIGLVIAAVAALTAGIYLLVRATNSETDAEEELNKQLEISKDLQIELNNVAKKTAQEQKIALSILTDNVKQRNLELKVLEDLKKEFPGFNAFISQNNELTDRGNEFLTRNIALQEIDAKLKALRDKKVETEIQNIEDFNEELESQNTFWGKLSASVRGSLTPFGKYVVMAKDLNAATEEGTRKIGIYNREIENLQGQYDDALGAIRPFTDELEAQRKKEEEAAKASQKAADATEKRRAAELKLLQDRIAAQKKYLQDLKTLTDIETDVNTKLIEKLEEAINKQDELLKKRTENTKTETEKLQENLNEFLFGITADSEKLKVIDNTFGSVFNIITESIKTGVINPLLLGRKSITEFIGVYNQANKDLSKGTGFEKYAQQLDPKVLKNFTEENKRLLEDFFNLFVRLQGELGSDKFKNIFGKAFNAEQSKKALLDIQTAAQELLSDTTLLPGELEKKLAERIQKILGVQAKSVVGTDFQKEAARGYNEELSILIETLSTFGVKQAKVVEDVKVQSKQIIELNKELTKNSNELNRTSVASGGFVSEQIKLTANEVDVVSKQVRESAGQSAKAYTDFVQNIINNTSGIRDKYLKILDPKDLLKIIKEGAMGLKDLNLETEQDVANLIASLQGLQIELGDTIAVSSQEATEDSAKLGEGYTSLAEIIELLIKKQKELQQATKDSAKTWEETFSESNFKRIADIVLNVFNDISARLSNIVATQNSLLLEQLTYQEQLSISELDKLRGDNAKENEKIEAEKLKIQQEYAKRKFEVEKKARVQELQFTLANSLAQSAQAIINALATLPAPFGAIYSGVIAGLTAAQVAIINDQIQFTQSKQFIARRGGLIGGDSHDDISGGVPAMLEGGEFVVNKEAVRNFGDIVSSINTSTGGRPLSIDDSRIVQAIAKQNMNTKTPIKAYVLYNDIQDTTKLNTKIEQLARL